MYNRISLYYESKVNVAVYLLYHTLCISETSYDYYTN